MEPKRERERSYSGLSQEQQKRANENRILLAKSRLSILARGLWLTLFTRQSSTETGCWVTTEWLQELFPGKSKGKLYEALGELESLFMVERKPGTGKRRNTYHTLQPHQWPAETVEWLRKSAVELDAAVEAKKVKRNQARRQKSESCDCGRICRSGVSECGRICRSESAVGHHVPHGHTVPLSEPAVDDLQNPERGTEQ